MLRYVAICIARVLVYILWFIVYIIYLSWSTPSPVVFRLISSADTFVARYKLVSSAEDGSDGFELRDGLLAHSGQTGSHVHGEDGGGEVVLSPRARLGSGSGDGITLVDMKGKS